MSVSFWDVLHTQHWKCLGRLSYSWWSTWQQVEGLWCWPVLSLAGNKHQPPLAIVCCAFHSAEVTRFLTYLLAAVLRTLELFLGHYSCVWSNDSYLPKIFWAQSDKRQVQNWENSLMVFSRWVTSCMQSGIMQISIALIPKIGSILIFENKI